MATLPDVPSRRVGKRRSSGKTGLVGITTDDVVTTALHLIDSQGLDAFSMRTLARELGVYPATVYWHAGNRDRVLAQVVGRVVAGLELPASSDDWRHWITAFAHDFREVMHKHPNLAPLIGELVSNVAPDLPLVEGMLESLTAAGFRGDALVDAYNAIFGAITGYVGAELSASPRDNSAEWVAATRACLEDIPAEFPLLAANRDRLLNKAFMTRWESGASAPLDGGFRLLVTMLVRGLEESALGSPT